MNTGSSSRQNQSSPKLTLPSRLPALRPEPDVLEPPGDLDVAAGPAQPLLPQRHDAARFLGPDGGVRLEDDLLPSALGLERGDRVLGQRAGVDPAADRLDVGPGVQLRAAGQAGDHAQHLLAAPGGGLRGDVLVADEPGHVVAGAAALLDVGGDRADPGIGQVPGHPAQRRALVDDIRVHDQDGLHPVVGQDDAQAVIEGAPCPRRPCPGAGGRRSPGTGPPWPGSPAACRRCWRRPPRRSAGVRAGTPAA